MRNRTELQKIDNISLWNWLFCGSLRDDVCVCFVFMGCLLDSRTNRRYTHAIELPIRATTG